MVVLVKPQVALDFGDILGQITEIFLDILAKPTCIKIVQKAASENEQA